MGISGYGKGTSPKIDPLTDAVFEALPYISGSWMYKASNTKPKEGISMLGKDSAIVHLTRAEVELEQVLRQPPKALVESLPELRKAYNNLMSVLGALVPSAALRS